MNQIGLKLADGSFYPVLDEGSPGRKRLVLTTARNNQNAVRVDLYRGADTGGGGIPVEPGDHLGTLSIENIPAAVNGEPEIELILSLEEDGTLEASAADLQGGDRKSLSVALGQPSVGGPPEVDPEREGRAARVKTDRGELKESLLTGETYPIGPTDRRVDHLHRRRRSPLLVVGFVVLALILIAVAAFVILRSIDGPRIPPLFGLRLPTEQLGPEGVPGRQAAQSAEPPAAPVPGAGDTDPGAPEAQTPAPPGRVSATGSAEAARPADAATAAEKKTSVPASNQGEWHNIRRGDTLWGIAAAYYRNPWLYPWLARANKITDPDLIFAGSKLFIPER